MENQLLEEISYSLGELIIQMAQDLNLKRGKWTLTDNDEGPATYEAKGTYNFPNGVVLEYSAICDEDEHHWLGCRLLQDGVELDKNYSSELYDRTFMYLIIYVLSKWFPIELDTEKN